MPRIDDFLNTLHLAREKLLSRDPEEICRNAVAELLTQDNKKRIVFPYFQRKVEVAYPEGIVVYDDGKNKLSLQEQGLILHYLLGACDISLSQEL